MRTKTKDKTTKKLTIFALLSVGIFILTAIFAFAYLFEDLGGKRELIEIPSFRGAKYSEISAPDRIELERELVFSDDTPEGEIISQFPYAGAKRKLAEGEKYTVKLTVSMGKERQTLPNLKNFKYTEAAAVLRSIGAEIRIVSVYDDETERDIVLRTSPLAGNRVERGEQVTLFVSRNHIHSSVRVGDFVGLPLDEAAAEILAQGLTLDKIGQDYSDEFAAGEVISQSIAPNSYVLHGTKIDVTVSAGQRKEELHPFRRDIISENGE